MEYSCAIVSVPFCRWKSWGINLLGQGHRITCGRVGQRCVQRPSLSCLTIWSDCFLTEVRAHWDQAGHTWAHERTLSHTPLLCFQQKDVPAFGGDKPHRGFTLATGCECTCVADSPVRSHPKAGQTHFRPLERWVRQGAEEASPSSLA